MPFEIVWLQAAIHSPLAIVADIAADNFSAAWKLEEKLFSATDPLAAHPYPYPYLYRSSPFVPGQREIVVTANYIVLYEVDDARRRVTVTNVAHSRMKH